jgi:hypothetical protein
MGDTIESIAAEFGVKDISVLSKSQREILDDLDIGRHNLGIAEEEYDITMSAMGPGLLALVGLPLILLFGIGILLIILALIWFALRVLGRSHAYMKKRDLEEKVSTLEKRFRESL